MSVRAVLDLPVMRSARVVAGDRGVDASEVRWVAVAEGPVEDFVMQGELILTSGMGCDADGLAQLVTEVRASGAAALCVGVGPGRFVEALGPPATDIANADGFPLIEIPWELRFSDITRAIVERLLAQRHAQRDADADRARFTNLVLDGLGFRGIADALESTIPRRVIILDGEFRPQAFGSSAAASLGRDGVAACQRAGELLSQDQVDELARLFPEEAPQPLDGLPALELGAGLALTVTARSRPVAYLYALDPPTGDTRSGSPDAVTMTQATEAIAMESLRRLAAADAEARVRGNFLWGLATGSIDPQSETAQEASLLGYPARAHYHVVLLDVDHEFEPTDVERRVARQAFHHQIAVHAAVQGSRLLLLVEADEDSPELSAETVELLLGRRTAHPLPTSRVGAGVSRGRWTLEELPNAYRECERTLAVGRAILGPYGVATAAQLGPFLMVSHLADDPQSREMALGALRPLIAYDRKRSRGLLETLETYLDEGCNASRTARRLFLSRHSLLYRVKKIEELTGCSLESRNDRFLLELSLRLLRFGVLDEHER